MCSQPLSLPATIPPNVYMPLLFVSQECLPHVSRMPVMSRDQGINRPSESGLCWWSPSGRSSTQWASGRVASPTVQRSPVSSSGPKCVPSVPIRALKHAFAHVCERVGGGVHR